MRFTVFFAQDLAETRVSATPCAKNIVKRVVLGAQVRENHAFDDVLRARRLLWAPVFVKSPILSPIGRPKLRNVSRFGAVTLPKRAF